jgi:hypothetical protein
VRASSFERGPVFNGLCAEDSAGRARSVFGFNGNQLSSPVHSLTLYRTNKKCASTGEMHQLKIDSLDQNPVQSIEKIQNLLHLGLKLARVRACETS